MKLRIERKRIWYAWLISCADRAVLKTTFLDTIFGSIPLWSVVIARPLSKGTCYRVGPIESIEWGAVYPRDVRDLASERRISSLVKP